MCARSRHVRTHALHASSHEQPRAATSSSIRIVAGNVDRAITRAATPLLSAPLQLLLPSKLRHPRTHASTSPSFPRTRESSDFRPGGDGTQAERPAPANQSHWIPAFAGMTVVGECRDGMSTHGGRQSAGKHEATTATPSPQTTTPRFTAPIALAKPRRVIRDAGCLRGMKPEPCLRGRGRGVRGCRRNRARVGLLQLPAWRRRNLATARRFRRTAPVSRSRPV
jgi:hypothetical protein